MKFTVQRHRLTKRLWDKKYNICMMGDGIGKRQCLKENGREPSRIVGRQEFSVLQEHYDAKRCK